METSRISKVLTVLFAAVLCFGPVGLSGPLGTAFTYQGQLIDANQAADGLYDFQFKLFNADSNGNKLGTDINEPNFDVIDGYFTVELDFNDANAFRGDARWLQIGVRPGNKNDPNVYTVLSPRQEVTPTPYSIYAQSSGGLNTSGDLVLKSGSGNVAVGSSDEPATLHIFGERRMYDANGAGGLSTLGIYPTEFDGASYSDTNGAQYFTTKGPITIKPADGNLAIGTASNPANLNNFGQVRIYRKTAGGTGKSGTLGVYPTEFDGASYGEPSEIEWDFGDGEKNAIGVHFTSTGSDSNMAFCPDGGVLRVGALNKRTNLLVTGSIDVGDVNNPANLNNFGEVRIYSKTPGSSGKSGTLGVYPTDFEGASYSDINGAEFYTTKGPFTIKPGDGNMAIGSASKPANLHNFGEARTYRKNAGRFGKSGILGVYPTEFEGASYGIPAEIEFDFGDEEKNANTFVDYTSDGSGADIAFCPDGLKVWIGTPNKAVDLAVTGKLNIGDTNNPTDMEVTGKLGIGMTSPAEKLDVNGTARLRQISTTGDPNVYAIVCDATGKLFKSVSSQRYKTDVRNLDADTDAVLKLRPVRFQWQTTGQEDVGLIAEEVEKVSKDLVIYDSDGRPDGVKYEKVALYLLSVVKNQQEGKGAVIESLQKENEEIKARLAAMESIVAKLSVQQEGGVR